MHFMKRKRDKVQRKLRTVATWIPYILVIIIPFYFALFQLPQFNPNKMHEVTGTIDHVTYKAELRLDWALFDLNGDSYCITLSGVVKASQKEQVVNQLKDCEQNKRPVTCIITDEWDYLNIFVSDRKHVIGLIGENVQIPVSAYKCRVRILQFTLFGISVVFMIPVLYYFCIDYLFCIDWRRKADKRKTLKGKRPKNTSEYRLTNKTRRGM